MYFMFVDESGDTGISNSQTTHFILTGMVVHEANWQSVLNKLTAFRRVIKTKYHLRIHDEIHAGEMISRSSYHNMPKYHRLAILRELAHELASMQGQISIINVHVDKQNLLASLPNNPIYQNRKINSKPSDLVFEYAWNNLIQRFSNTLKKKNFPGSDDENERGLIFTDNTDNKKLRTLLRRMRVYNPVPNTKTYIANNPNTRTYRNLPTTNILEDPNIRDSADSHFIQCADTVSFLLRQHYEPNGYMRKKAGQNYFTVLKPVLCKVTSTNDPEGLGVVHIP